MYFHDTNAQYNTEQIQWLDKLQFWKLFTDKDTDKYTVKLPVTKDWLWMNELEKAPKHTRLSKPLPALKFEWNLQNDLWAKQIHKSAFTSEQSVQSLRLRLFGRLTVSQRHKNFFKQKAKTLISLQMHRVRCVHMPICRFCCDAPQVCHIAHYIVFKT